MNNIEIQQALIKWGFLDPPADGLWGIQSKEALKAFQRLAELPSSGENTLITLSALRTFKPPALKLGNDFASRLAAYMAAQHYFIARGEGRFNVVYVEGADEDGTPNEDRPNEFNDRRLILQVSDDGVPTIIGNWDATTEPGDRYTYYPLNLEGAFRIAFGQYLNCWVVGTHGNSNPHEALIQSGPVSGYRDYNQDFSRIGDQFVTGLFGVNQHWGYDLPKNQVGNASAGCLVGRTREGHVEFMDTLKSDTRYQVNNGYAFITAVLPGDKLD